MPRASLNKGAKARLHAGLQGRRSELEEAILVRLHSIGDPLKVRDQRYVEGLPVAISAGLDYGLAAIERPQECSDPPIPPELLVQARLGARGQVPLEAILRRYCAGHTLLTDALIEEAEAAELPRVDLKRFVRALAPSFERLLEAVSEEHSRESATRPESGDRHRTELVGRLLAGEKLETSELSYNFDAAHLGLVAVGPEATEAVRVLAADLDRTVLVVSPGEELIWAWLGGRRSYDSAQIGELRAAVTWSSPTAVGVGEPGEGLAGWRFTHRQAAAALSIARRRSDPIASYAQAPLLAAALKDDLLANSLRQLYLAPLGGQRDGGAVAKDTLRAYFEAGGNVSSAAAALRVNRRTVSARISAIEGHLERSVDDARAEIEAALQLDEID
jgi:hypothetical protein